MIPTIHRTYYKPKMIKGSIRCYVRRSKFNILPSTLPRTITAIRHILLKSKNTGLQTIMRGLITRNECQRTTHKNGMRRTQKAKPFETSKDRSVESKRAYCLLYEMIKKFK